MKKKYDKEDEKFAEVIRALKELPTVEAPSDFEFKLKRRLHNLHAEKEIKVVKFNFSRIFIPASALALTSIILFFIFFNQQNSETENPLMAKPLERQDYYDKSVKDEKVDLLIDPVNITSNDVVIKKEAVSSPQKLSRKSSAIENNMEKSTSEDDLRKRRLQEFLTSREENNVDQSLKARPQTASSGRYQSGRTVNFDGFNLINEENDRMLYELKARMDSLKKWMRDNR